MFAARPHSTPCPSADSRDDSPSMHEEPEPPFDLKDRTMAFALRVIRQFTALPETEEARVLGNSLLRSGTAVGAHFREAQRLRSKPEFTSKIADCLSELEATGYWLELLVRSGIVPAEKLASLQDENTQLLAILTTMARNAKRERDE